MSAPGSSTGSPTPPIQTLDAYRPLATQVKKPILPFIPSSAQASSNTPESLSSILQIPPQIYASRLSGKNVLLDTPFSNSNPPSSRFPGILPTDNGTVSPLVTGKKRNRGNESCRQIARRSAENLEKERRENGLDGVRKVMKRRKEGCRCVYKGMKVHYQSILPLNHLHTLYLCDLLNLPSLPSPIPTNFSSLPPTISSESIQSRLVKADFTGIKLIILSSRNPSIIGKEGIVIEETSGTFRIVEEPTSSTVENSQRIHEMSDVRIIPKDGTMFGISFPAYSPPPGVDDEEEHYPDLESHWKICPRIQLSLLGSAFQFRSGDRAGRKFRPSQGKGGGSGWGEEWIGREGFWGGLDKDSSRAREGKGEKRGQGKGKRTGGGMHLSSERRKRGVARRKDPLAGGTIQVL